MKIAGFIATIVSLIGGFFIGITSMMLGWGLQPKSWGWIIACFVATLVLVVFTNVIAAVADKVFE
jgi:uncharacterized membrane protein (UPF0136 family)